MNTRIAILLSLLATLSACGSGFPEPGEGPGFSIFTPALTSEEIHTAFDNININMPNEPGAADCPLGGRASFSITGASPTGGSMNMTAEDCGVEMSIRGESYEVIMNGSESVQVSVSGSTMTMSGSASFSFSGDLGFANQCSVSGTADFSNTFNAQENLTDTCTYRDGDGNELTYP